MDPIIHAELQVIVVLICVAGIVALVYADVWLLAKLLRDIRREIRLWKTEGWGGRR